MPTQRIIEVNIHETINNVHISFRRMAQCDLERLYIWLNKPHMRDYYQSKPISLEEVRQKFTPRLSLDHPTKDHIVLLDDQPIGKMQSYLIRDYQDWALIISQQKGVGIDLFIGEENYLGRGLGKRMLKEYVQTVLPDLFPEEQQYFICHDLTNEIAIRCSMSAGFVERGEVLEDGVPCKLLEFQRLPNQRSF